MINAQTIIVCPGCNADIYRVTADIIPGETILSANLFEPISENIPRLVDKVDTITCPYCRVYYCRNLAGRIQLHTKEGWQ